MVQMGVANMMILKPRWLHSSGNEAVLELCKNLVDVNPGRSGRIIVIEGAAGSGLTSLAQQVAHVIDRDWARTLEVSLSRADERHLLPEMAKSLGLPCLSSKAYQASERKAYELAFELRRIKMVIIHDFQDFLTGAFYENTLNMRSVVEMTNSPWYANVFIFCSRRAARPIRSYLQKLKIEFADIILAPMALDEDYRTFLRDVSIELMGADDFDAASGEAESIHLESKGWVGRTVSIVAGRAISSGNSVFMADK